METVIDGVYTERTRLVALVAALCRSLGLAAGLGEHDPADTAWDPAWRTIVFVDIPDGADGSFQASWHVALRDRALVEHLPRYFRHWDGHTTQEKYARIEAAVRRVPLVDLVSARAVYLPLRCEAADPAPAVPPIDHEHCHVFPGSGPCRECGRTFEELRDAGKLAGVEPAGTTARKPYEAPAVVATARAHRPRGRFRDGVVLAIEGCTCGWTAPIGTRADIEVLFNLHVAHANLRIP